MGLCQYRRFNHADGPAQLPTPIRLIKPLIRLRSLAVPMARMPVKILTAVPQLTAQLLVKPAMPYPAPARPVLQVPLVLKRLLKVLLQLPVPLPAPPFKPAQLLNQLRPLHPASALPVPAMRFKVQLPLVMLHPVPAKQQPLPRL